MSKPCFVVQVFREVGNLSGIETAHDRSLKDRAVVEDINLYYMYELEKVCKSKRVATCSVKGLRPLSFTNCWSSVRHLWYLSRNITQNKKIWAQIAKEDL